jgi:hypothetical protein
MFDANYMFVTSTTKRPMDLGGFDGADKWCNDLAQAAMLPGTYRAWLSDLTGTGTSAFTRLAEKNASGWYRVDGTPFANTVTDLMNSTIYYPPRLTERGDDIGETDTSPVATGTRTSTTVPCDFVNSCSAYTADGMTVAGYLDGGAAGWSDYETMGLPCTTPMHIYCFGINKHATVPPPDVPPDTKLAFIAAAQPGMGLTGFDSACQSAATTAGLTGTYKAWTSTTMAAAGFPGTQAWRRIDNVVVMTADHHLIAPIDHTLDNSLPRNWVFTGSTDPTTVAMSSGDCSDWTNGTTTTLDAVSGHPMRSAVPHAWSDMLVACAYQNNVYCVEQ